MTETGDRIERAEPEAAVNAGSAGVSEVAGVGSAVGDAAGDAAGDRAGDGDPRGRVVAVAKLWLDGRLTATREATLAVERDGRAWRVTARLPERDPFARAYGLSLQLGDGRALHGQVRLVAAGDGQVVFEGLEPPEGGWL